MEALNKLKLQDLKIGMTVTSSQLSDIYNIHIILKNSLLVDGGKQIKGNIVWFGKDGLYHLISCANVLHCENPLKVEDDWINDYALEEGVFDICNVDKELAAIIPAPTQMGKVYSRLILNTLGVDEDYVDGMIRVYNDDICSTIDNYNCSAFYEPPYVIARAYQNGGF